MEVCDKDSRPQSRGAKDETYEDPGTSDHVESRSKPRATTEHAPQSGYQLHHWVSGRVRGHPQRDFRPVLTSLSSLIAAVPLPFRRALRSQDACTMGDS